MKNNITLLLILEVVLVAALTGVSVYLTGQLWIILFGVIILASFFFLYSKQRKKYEDGYGMVENLTKNGEALQREVNEKIAKLGIRM